MGRIGPWELILILLVVLVIFGGTKLPQVGKGLGDAIREFRRASRGDDEAAAPKDAAQAKEAAAKEQTRS